MKAHLVQREYRDCYWERGKEDDFGIDQDDDDMHGNVGDLDDHDHNDHDWG